MQALNKIAGLMFVVALTVSVAAAQTSTQNPSSQTAPNAQSQTSSQPGAQPSSAAPQSGTSSPSSAAPQSQPGASGNAQQGAAANGGGSVEDELHLTDAQKQQLRPIIQEEITQINAVRDDQSLSMDQKRAKVEQIRQTEFPKIQAILTPEQITKLKDMQQKAHQQQGSTPPAQQQQQPH